MDVRPARRDEYDAVMGVLDAAMLETDADRVRAALGAPDDGGTVVLAAVDGGRVLGALVLDGEHVAAIAVRPGRRGQGVGAALVEAATARRERLVASFDAAVRPFYESLGFTVTPAAEDGRWQGVRE